MAAHGHQKDLGEDRIKLGGGYRGVMGAGLIAAAVGLLLSILPGAGYQRFLHAYLTAFVFFLSLALGAMFNILIHHTTRAGWNVTVRRTTENIAGTLPLFIILALPLLYSVIQNDGKLFPWALPSNSAVVTAEAGGHADTPVEGTIAGMSGKESEASGKVNGKETVPATAAEYAEQRAKQIKLGSIDREIAWKRERWFSTPFFLVRMALYLLVWTGLSMKYRGTSIEQDKTGDIEATNRMQAGGPLGLILLAFSITFASFDLLMSLDPRWYSTMFGVYYIAGCIVSGFATVIIGVFCLQQAGYLRGSVSTEHYHDLGKYLFGFTFFFGYIAFSQFMLLWYSSIPEEVTWFSRHGATTLHPTTWSYVILAILFGKFAIPFLGLVSRHAKRNKFFLTFWAVWILVFHFVDMYWVVLPQFGIFKPALVDLGTVLLIGGVFVAAVVRNMSEANLRPTHDPRLADALAFQNI